MAATSTNRSRPAKRRSKAKVATTNAKSATRRVTKKATARTQGATAKAKSAAQNSTKKARKKAGGRATVATQSSASRPSDVIALITADHVAVNKLFKRYSGLGPGARKSRRQVAERVIHE